MPRTRLLLPLIVLIATATAGTLIAQSQTDWPAWGGPNGNFRVDDVDVFEADRPVGLRVAWRTELGSGYSGIVVQGKTLVTMFSDSTWDFIVALDAETGSELWRFKMDSTYLGHFGSINGPIATPLIAKGKVVGIHPAGTLFTVDLATGQSLWQRDLVAADSAITPFYGFAVQPLLHHDKLIVATNGTRNNAISAFDLETGQTLWSAAKDTFDYQSPAVLTVDGREQIVFWGNRYLIGLHPETGDQLWQFAHGGDNHPMGRSGRPVQIGDDRFFLKNKQAESMMVNLSAPHERFEAAAGWKSRHIKASYVPPVFFDGKLYGYNSRIMTCIDAETGERVWRSRKPGDGFVVVVDGHLVIMTKDGGMHIAEANGKTYKELASLELFDQLVWAPAAFANGKLYARSITEVAAVNLVPADAIADRADDGAGVVPESEFARFVQKVEAAEDKKAMVDEFMAAQKSFPVIENDNIVHFLYRGEAEDISLIGDLVGWRYDKPLRRVEGTDLYYYSAKVEPDARLTYRFMKNMAEPVADTLNTRKVFSVWYQNASWFAMPKWKEPEHLKPAPDAKTGRIDSLSVESASLGKPVDVAVYLPAGYDAGTKQYPIAYVHAGRGALGLGGMPNALDNLIGESVEPVIVAFLPNIYGSGYGAMVGAFKDKYAKVFVEELVPAIESKYRVKQDGSSRANIGTMMSGFMAYYSTFKYPGKFGRIAIQAIWCDEKADGEALALISSSQPRIEKLYIDWGKYDARSPLEGFSMAEDSQEFWSFLKKHGYNPVGGMAHDGAGYASAKNRYDAMFKTLYPISGE